VIVISSNFAFAYWDGAIPTQWHKRVIFF